MQRFYSRIIPITIILFLLFVPNNVLSRQSDDAVLSNKKQQSDMDYLYHQGAVIRGDTSKRHLALIFTGGDYGDGGEHISEVLKKKDIKAGFFFTGDFYRNPEFKKIITQLKNNGHYLGPHSDKHLLYCSWKNRDSLLVSRREFLTDLENNYKVMERFGIKKQDAKYFIPPYEWYNQQIVHWANENDVITFNFTPGTSSNADYTTPEDKNYISSEKIYQRILHYEKTDPNGLNGFILLLHIGTHQNRTDKFYYRLEELINYLLSRGYGFKRIDKLISF